MQRKFNFEVGNCYHIFNRGVEKRDIFRDDMDWGRFHQLLYLANSKDPVDFKSISGNPFEINRASTLVDVLSYTLMPNHYHMILHEKIPGGISKFLGKVATAYSMYFNAKYERSGPVFCRPFRARHIDTDDYFRWAFSYVNLNALPPFNLDDGKTPDAVDEIRAFMNAYKYSSYTDYLHSERLESKILNKEKLLFDISELLNIDEMFAILKDASDQRLQRKG